MKPPAYDVEKLRRQFPMLKQQMHGRPLVYLDSAATSHKPDCVIKAISDFYAEEYATVNRSVYELCEYSTARYNNVRESLKRFINAQDSSEIIFTKGTTESINLVASSFGRFFLNEGDEIIISHTEHHSNIVPWQILAQERKLQLKIIPVDDQGLLIIEEFARLLTSRTKLVSVAHIANTTGTIHPIEEMIHMAHEKGAKFFLDGAQSAPHLSVDVQGLGVDFFAFSAHKCYGPTGIGILYGKKELLERMPPYQYGSDMIDQVTFNTSTFQKPPLKFESGTPMIAQVIGFGEAIRFVQDVGLNAVADWEHQLLQYATHQLKAINGLRMIGTAEKKGAIITFVIEGLHSLDVGTLLGVRGIAVRTGHLCAQPTMQRFGVDVAIRVSFALYNTMEEVDFFIRSLSEVVSILRS